MIQTIITTGIFIGLPHGIGMIFLKRFDYIYLSMLIAMTGCALSGPMKPSKDNRIDKTWTAPPASAVFDFQQRCGVDPKRPSDSVIYEQNLQSLNIVTDQEVAGIKAHVEATASVSIKSTFTESTEVTKVNIIAAKDLNNPASPLTQVFAKIGSQLSARNKGGTNVSKTLPRNEWLNLTYGTNLEFKDLLCTVTGIASRRRLESPQREYRFQPALIESVSPLASPEQFLAEIGQGRTLHINADIVDVSSGRKIASSKGTVVIIPVQPNATFRDSLTSMVREINADSAWQVTVDFPEFKDSQDKLSETKIFYINHKAKRFEAIVQQAAGSGSTPSSLPPVVLLAN
jgi:hypothetical protein